MSDSLDAAIDAALPAAIEAATTPSSETKEASKPVETKAAPSERAATPTSGAAPTPAGKDGTATTAPTASAGKLSQESDELTPEEQKRGVPFERHSTILKNTREKEAARVYAEEIGYSRDEMRQWKPHMDAIRDDAVGYWKLMGERLKAAGMLPADAAPVAAPTPKPQAERPQPDLRAEDGTLAYSAKQNEALVQWEIAKVLEGLDDRFKPFEQVKQNLEAQERTTTADKYATAKIAEAATWEGFEELRPKIYAMMKADGRKTIESCYLTLHPAWAKEQRQKLTSEVRDKTLGEIAAKPKGPQKELRPSAASIGSHTNGRRLTTDEKMDQALAQFQ